jgi:uncharacterized protein YkwD
MRCFRFAPAIALNLLMDELPMRESSASGRSRTRAVQQRGKVIPMPMPKVVRQRRAVRRMMVLLGLGLMVAVAGRVYLNTRLPRSQEQLAGVSADETRILELVNQVRKKAGLAALKLSGRLAVAARGHSYDMALRHYFANESADGVSAEQRIRGSGIAYAEMGENIYMEAYPNREGMPERAIEGWLGSPGHRKNLLSSKFTATGVGTAHAADGSTYVTQDFIRE